MTVSMMASTQKHKADDCVLADMIRFSFSFSCFIFLIEISVDLHGILWRIYELGVMGRIMPPSLKDVHCDYVMLDVRGNEGCRQN